MLRVPMLMTEVSDAGFMRGGCPAGYHLVRTTAGDRCVPNNAAQPVHAHRRPVYEVRETASPYAPANLAFSPVAGVSGLGQLGQAGCPSPVWYVVGGAVAWALGGEIFKDLFGLGSKAARHGIAHVERKIPEARR